MKKYILVIASVFVFALSLKSQTIVTFYTNQGSFELELYDTLVPITANNFKTLVNDKFYDGVIFHRIISGFMIQGGDPTGTGSGGPGYSIPDEFDSTLSNLVQTISMANAGPNTGGSQFFINVVNNTYLDFDKPPSTSKHPVFGKVIAGWDTVKIIENVPTNGSDRPISDVIMDSVRVTQIPASVASLELENILVELYPNPVNSNSILKIHVSKTENGLIQLMGLDGKVIQSKNMVLYNGLNSLGMNEMISEELPSGVYVLAIQYGKEWKNIKLIK